MSDPKDDEIFKTIFEMNGLADMNGLSDLENNSNTSQKDITIKDFQVGLSDLCATTTFVSTFLLECFNAYTEGKPQDIPSLSTDVVNPLIAIFKYADDLLEALENEEDEDD